MRIPNEDPEREIKEKKLLIVIFVLLLIFAFELMLVFDIPLFRGMDTNYINHIK